MELLKSKFKKIQWGVSGCGKITEHSFVPAVQHLKRSQIKSVYSNSIERAKRIATKSLTAKAFDDFDEFLKSDFEILYIASSNELHYEQAIKAAKAGKHIFCEKPMALNSKQAEEMLKVANENNVSFRLNYTFRFHPLVQKAKELVEKSLLGSIISINGNFNTHISPSTNFRFDAQKGGGALFDLGTHLIDILRYFGGEILEIKGIVEKEIYKSDVDDFVSAIVKFEKGYFGYFSASFNTLKANNRIEIIGQKGTITIEDFVGKPIGVARLIIDISGERRKVFRKKANIFLEMLKQVQKSYLKNTKPLSTGEDGLINLKLMEKLVKNANS